MGNRIRAARLGANLSQEGPAHQIGAKRRTVVRIELGITSPPVDRLLDIARVLDLPPADLLSDATATP
ncbi:helix-turn-helix transcriptional regulator [Streptomyces sp. NPDC050560]|uniref:helix-turn-helix transcriptional regulator n=1 Tax=Streptomyces sp. NPDC050560 TaxID=3365630 RepID=UPI00379B3CC8